MRCSPMRDDMGPEPCRVLSGVSLDDKGRQIVDLILRTASGQVSRSEALGLGDHEFLPWQIGAVL